MKTTNSSVPLRLRSECLATLAVGLALLMQPLAAQDLPFDSGSTGADGPLAFREIASGRRSHALAYDPVRQQVVLFGGFDGAGRADTWVWSGGNWTQLFPPASPPDRWQHGMTWDAARNEIVLFGGTRSTGRLNDTWTWDGTTWTQKTPVSSPSPRDGFAIAYDAARQRVVIFSGTGGAAETWLWDGTNWTPANPATSPPATATSAMAYDGARQEVVLFGNYGQTWIWNGTTWSQRGSLNVPSARSHPAMAYDPVRQTVLMFSGSNTQQTWSWNGVDWTQLSPSTSPGGAQFHAVIWDAARQRVVLFSGDYVSLDNYSADTWLWDGGIWSFFSGKTQFFDMATRPDGIWNFTTIEVPTGVTVRFLKNTANTPVRWLATENVTISGSVNVSGDLGANSTPAGQVPRGGPGGFDGGRGGIRFDASGSYVGSPGQGPGGGEPGTAQQTNPNLRDGQGGEYKDSYGNVFLQPLVGGSGGGGGASNDNTHGGNGGGGGGAILIASSRDMILNGSIRANGGQYEWSGASYGGRGSGGAILLRADRVTGNGTLEAFGGQNNIPNGRIRVEAYARTLGGAQIPVAVVGFPAAAGELNQIGTLTIVSVKGINVVEPPTGSQLTPDVVFSDAGPVSIVVNGTGIPEGTPVTLRITTAGSVINAGPANLLDGTVTFNVTVPKGVGTLQASAEFTP